jgi:hypothetical protein
VTTTCAQIGANAALIAGNGRTSIAGAGPIRS